MFKKWGRIFWLEAKLEVGDYIFVLSLPVIWCWHQILFYSGPNRIFITFNCQKMLWNSAWIFAGKELLKKSMLPHMLISMRKQKTKWNKKLVQLLQLSQNVLQWWPTMHTLNINIWYENEVLVVWNPSLFTDVASVEVISSSYRNTALLEDAQIVQSCMLKEDG